MDDLNKPAAKPIEFIHANINGMPVVIADLRPDELPAGVHLMLFQNGSLEKCGDVSLPAGCLIMLIDPNVAALIRGQINAAKIKDPSVIAKREAALRNGFKS